MRRDHVELAPARAWSAARRGRSSAARRGGRARARTTSARRRRDRRAMSQPGEHVADLRALEETPGDDQVFFECDTARSSSATANRLAPPPNRPPPGRHRRREPGSEQRALDVGGDACAFGRVWRRARTPPRRPRRRWGLIGLRQRMGRRLVRMSRSRARCAGWARAATTRGSGTIGEHRLECAPAPARKRWIRLVRGRRAATKGRLRHGEARRATEHRRQDRAPRARSTSTWSSKRAVSRVPRAEPSASRACASSTR